MPIDIKIPDYELIEEIGSGGMSTVYLGMQVMLERKVAIKVLRQRFSLDHGEFKKRFLTEGKVLAKLRHENIVSIINIGEANGLLYMVMEYVEGGTLHDRLKISELTVDQAIEICSKVGMALYATHSKHIVHRDLKPSNILLHDLSTPLLTDFGIARQTDQNIGLTQTGHVLGTLQYMSPEQIRGYTVDHRSDIYSLGLLFYRLLAGKMPFVADSQYELSRQQCEDPPPPLRPQLAGIQPVLDVMLAKNPDDRFQNCIEFCKAVRNLSLTDEGFAAAQKGGTREYDSNQFRFTSRNSKYRNDHSSDSHPTPYSGKQKRRHSDSHSDGWSAHKSGRIKKPTQGDATQKFLKAFQKGVQKSKVVIAGLGITIVSRWQAFIQFMRRILNLIGRKTRFLIEIDYKNRAALLIRKPKNLLSKIAHSIFGITSGWKNRIQNIGKEQKGAILIGGTAIVIVFAVSTLILRESESTSPGQLPTQPLSPPGKVQAKTDTLKGREDEAIEEVTQITANENIPIPSDDDLKVNPAPTPKDDLTPMVDVVEISDAVLNNIQQAENENEEITSLLARGYEYLAKNQLTVPVDANAVSEFNKVLVLDTDNVDAINGLAQIGRNYLGLANREINNGNWQKAETYWQKSSEISPGLTGSVKTREVLDRHAKNQTSQSLASQKTPSRNSRPKLPPSKISTYSLPKLNLSGSESSKNLYRLAEADMNSGNEMRAYALYKEILRRDPGFTSAARRLSSGSRSYITFASRDINKGSLFSAHEKLSIALALDPTHSKFDTVRREYLTSRDNLINASLLNKQAKELGKLQTSTLLQSVAVHHARFRSDPGNKEAAESAMDGYQKILKANNNDQLAKQGLKKLCNDLINASQRAIDHSRMSDATWFYDNARKFEPNHPGLSSLKSQLN